MKTFLVIYKVQFTTGLLKGIETELNIEYPMFEFDHVMEEFDRDIENQVNFRSGTSSYRILEYKVRLLMRFQNNGRPV